MIIGSGLMARAFSPRFLDDQKVLVYAAGVSNSSCNDLAEFARENARLRVALVEARKIERFVYFSTCSIADPESSTKAYPKHKLQMEDLVRKHPGHLIIRLPQVAGSTPNPHTLMNYLHARISRSERFQLWVRARRNIIDVVDVAHIAEYLINVERAFGETISIAATSSHAMGKIVEVMEKVLGKPAIYETVEAGGSYDIDVTRILPAITSLNLTFDLRYLEKVVAKYHGK